ncbi:ABC transporter permease [Corynebacterium aquilae DSM 44791]|uniref:ABC transporter permease n=1 Tax=Corynebacterium aquilae DSM 44791 TaxID=1431546 RepID=A0A1L7CGU7_9CORY|nr:ABC transporter permease [Corynebacterium aquilae DSM 44791]
MNPGLRARITRRRTDIGHMVVRRLAVFIPLLLLITLAVFGLAAVSPFDPLEAYTGGRAGNLSTEQAEKLSHTLGLDIPWWQAWMTWIADLLRGDLGTSRYYRMPVSEVLAQRLPWTLLLGSLGLLLAIVLAVILGTIAGVRPHSPTAKITDALAGLLQATPPFVLALGALSVFALYLRWVPTGGLTDPGADVTFTGTVRHIITPAVVLGLSQLPWLVLSLKESVRATMGSDAIRGARVRGLDEKTIVRGHVIPAALPPFVALIGTRLPELIVGSTLVEAVFSWPGLGFALVQACQSMDFPLLAFLTLATTAVVLLGNLLADILIVVSDPRVDADV